LEQRVGPFQARPSVKISRQIGRDQMRKFQILGLALFALLSTSAYGPATPAGDEKVDADSIMKVEREWTKAFVTGDTDYLDQLLEPDYESVNYKGEVRSRQRIMDFARGHRDHPLPVPEFHAPTVRIHGNAAIAIFDSQVEDTAAKQNRMVRFVDTFVFYDGRWHVLYTEDVALAEKSPGTTP
jgi:hypothetical protein